MQDARPIKSRRGRRRIRPVNALWTLLLTSVFIAVAVQFILYTSKGRACGEEGFACKYEEARRKLAALKRRQSRTVTSALREYERRTGRKPVRGMEQWFEMAISKDSPLIDEYDQIDADLAPFRALTASELEERIDSAIVANADVTEARRLAMLEVKDGRVSVGGFSFVEISNATMVEMIEPIAHLLPNLRIPVNWFPQPRVLGASSDRGLPVHFQDRSGRENWDLLRETCPISFLHSDASSIDRPTIDVCEWKESQRHQHGMFVAPVSFYATDSVVPILSRGKLSTMKDILFPNPCYWADRYRLWTEPDSVPFKQKSFSLYWRGQTTGVVLSEETLYKTHRMRFMALLSWMQAWTDIFQFPYDQRNREAFEAADETRKAAGMEVDVETMMYIDRLSTRTFDIGFDRIFNVSTEEFAGVVKATYRFTPRDFPRDMYRHQFVADIDGESMSCRFYSQLASASVPIKQTLFAEWHDERIVPWLHYIPLSHTMHELPALLRWLSSKDGQRVAEQIGIRGQRWAARALRKTDITLYMYRLLLEYAALTAASH